MPQDNPQDVFWKEEMEKKYPFHPTANLFPILDYDDLAALADDIVDHGLNAPIELFQGKIIDGRNRFKACLQMGVEPKFVEIDIPEDELMGHVMSKNLRRRHLTNDQKVELAITLWDRKFTQIEIAKVLRVSQGIVNKWLKDKIKIDNTKTRTDSKGRERPTSYKKGKKEETPEEKTTRLTQEAGEALENWLETYKELGQKVVSDIVEVWMDNPFFRIKTGDPLG